MANSQVGILTEETLLARYMYFSLIDLDEINIALDDLNNVIDHEHCVVGFGSSLVTALGATIPGLTTFPAISHVGIDVPSTPAALWVWLRGIDRGEIFHRSRIIEAMLSPAFALDNTVDAFQYDANRDLSGYEDGTENPQGDEAVQAAIVQGQGEGMDGSSFVAVQQWLHDFETLEDLGPEEQDDIFGRHLDDNEEFDEAPLSAHTKRAAQENFTPQAYLVRRSMPWADGMHAGIMFVAFGHSFQAYESILRNMLGLNDGVIDGLFSFTRPITGAYFWCPPVRNNKLDLRALGLDT